MADHLEESTDFVTLFFKDEELRRFLSRRLLDDVYGRIREASAAEHTNVIPLAMVSPEQVRPFVNAVPVYDLKVAAGRFSAPQTVQEVAQQREVTSPAEFEWVTPGGRTKPAPGLFVAQVTGESMNRRIPDGAWCLWRLNPSGSRQGKIVLARHDSIADPDLGSYTVKRYESEKTATDDGMWRHTRVTLHPDSHNDGFEPIVLEGLTEGDLRIIAELVEVLSTGDGATGT